MAKEAEKANEYLQKYLELGEKFKDPVKVKLELISVTPGGDVVGVRDIAVSTAKQCYYSGTSVIKERRSEKDQALADSTLESGHLTTLDHSRDTSHLGKISRRAVCWLHGQPFYNTSQQSQRYAEIRPDSIFLPPELTPDQEKKFLEVAKFEAQQFEYFSEILRPEIENRMRKTFIPKDNWDEKVKKRCQEVARYVLPIAQFTEMFYSEDTLGLLRRFQGLELPDVTDEERYLVARMIQSHAELDPTILQELREPIKLKEPRNIDQRNIGEQVKEFDKRLRGKETRLVGMTPKAREILSNLVRNALGTPKRVMSDEEALSTLLDPNRNNLLASVVGVIIDDPLSRSLTGVNLTILTRMSLTDYAQAQRHRTTLGNAPPIEMIFYGKPDFYTPKVIKENENPKINRDYQKVMKKIYKGINECVEIGIPLESALMLLPNAHNIRVTESGNLLNYFIRWKERLCFNAQEHICDISIEQVLQTLKKIPEADKMLRAKCAVRRFAGEGRCPEGKDRYCGVPVFTLPVSRYREKRVI